MLPKKNRLRFWEFKENQKEAKKFSLMFVNLILKPGKDFSRVVILVPKTLDKRSSYRHQTKRILVEILRERINKIKKPVDILIKAKKIIKKEDISKIKEEINEILNRAIT